MYEEEDDDLPSQYRRLTAHLQTGSSDFNRRLAAYLTNHVAMRSAVDQAITASYAQQFPNAPHFAHNSLGSFPSPFPGPSAPSASIPATPTSPHLYRTAPYPMPGMHGYRNHAHDRAASISNGQELQRQPSGKGKEIVASPKPSNSRRASMPAPKPVLADLKDTDVKHATEDPSSEQSADAIKQEEPTPSLPLNFSPFTTSLAPNTQQLLGSMLDPNDPLTFSLMSGSGGMSLPQYDTSFYNYAPKDPEPDSLTGMNSTLAPPASSQEGSSIYQDQSTPMGTAPSSKFRSQFEDIKGESFLNLDGDGGSNAVTPGANSAWDAFIDDSTWAENAS
jgi:hypothetical protein